MPGPGVYRVEVRVPGRPCPGSSRIPIYVFDDARRAPTRGGRGLPAGASAAPGRGRARRLRGPDRVRAGCRHEIDRARPRSSIPRAASTAGERPASSSAWACPTADHPHVFAALVDRTKRDLTGRKGLVFSIRADGEYRIWVQVRDENPASRDEGTEWWFASVRTSRDWQRVALPFSRLRSINPNTDGRLDLDKVRAIVFVLDKGAVKPGTAGTIWLDDLGVY